MPIKFIEDEDSLLESLIAPTPEEDIDIMHQFYEGKDVALKQLRVDARELDCHENSIETIHGAWTVDITLFVAPIPNTDGGFALLFLDWNDNWGRWEWRVEKALIGLSSLEAATGALLRNYIDDYSPTEDDEFLEFLNSLSKTYDDTLTGAQDGVRKIAEKSQKFAPVFEKPMSNGVKSNALSPKPHGVPLDELKREIERTNMPVKREGNSLIVTWRNLATRVEVVAPKNPDVGDARISGIVIIKADLPADIEDIAKHTSSLKVLNMMAGLGAVTQENGRFYVGSRLSIYEDEDAWSIQSGLILHSIYAAADPIAVGMRKKVKNIPIRKLVPSAWTESDFELVHSKLSRICACNVGGLGLTAEFGLRTGEVSAALGHNKTALWQMRADEHHPQVGSGLFCVLNMPQTFGNETELNAVLAELNKMEMEGEDMPPHFGAWCTGGQRNNPAYVSFLPNGLHSQKGIALNMSVWAMARANLADATLQIRKLGSADKF